MAMALEGSWRLLYAQSAAAAEARAIFFSLHLALHDRDLASAASSSAQIYATLEKIDVTDI